jgi:competence protein ComEA
MVAGIRPTVGDMRTELPAERLHRRLAADPDASDTGAQADPDSSDPTVDQDVPKDEATDEDQNSLLPRWLPDASPRAGWLARVRADPGRAGAIALAVVAALAVLITVFTLLRDRPAPVMSAKLPPVERAASASPRSSAAPGAGQPATPERPVVVSVVGLVHTPGLVTLAPGARIADAVQAAGGAVDGADTIGLNMARPVGDGEQIVVGLAPVSGQPAVLGSSVSSGSAPASGSPPGSGPTPGSTKPKGGEVVDLNSATVQQLDALPGVGPVTAAAIVAWRQAHGRFTSVDQLADVDGIGPARLDKLRPLVRV